MGLVTGLVIAGGISAAASAYSAHKGAKAAEKASAQQQQSGREALALQQRMYEQTRTDLSPYRTQGGQGLTALSALLGLPEAPAGAPAAAPGAGAPPGAVPGAPGGAPVGPNGLTYRQAFDQARQPGSGATAQSAYGVPPGGAAPMVLLTAPNGQRKPVPADQVDYYLARGARRA